MGVGRRAVGLVVLTAAVVASSAASVLADPGVVRNTPPSRTYGEPPGSGPQLRRLTELQSQTAAPPGFRGLDVSNWQKTIAWPSVAAAGYRFAWAKASEGTFYRDPYYPANRRGAHAVGMRIGAYDYGRPSGPTLASAASRGSAEAAYFLGVATPQLGELRPALDIETTGGLSPPLLSAWVQGWVHTVTIRLGYHPMVYTSPYFWQTALAGNQTFARNGVRLWLAQWTSAPTPDPPAGNWAGHGWQAWQWSDCGTVPGITTGCVDMDVANPVTAVSALVMGTPRNDQPPSATGTMRVGAELTAHVGAWSGPDPITFVWRWIRCGVDGTDCHSVTSLPRYRLTSTDRGHTIRVVVTATNRYGSTWVTGVPTPVIS
jgi:GH25 family lysozyme M1 (1,4-beta-N-acetylmuramidase)